MTPNLIQLHELISPDRIIDLKASTKKEALEELCALASTDPNVEDGAAFLEAIYKREELVSTGVGLGIAMVVGIALAETSLLVRLLLLLVVGGFTLLLVLTIRARLRTLPYDPYTKVQR